MIMWYEFLNSYYLISNISRGPIIAYVQGFPCNSGKMFGKVYPDDRMAIK